MIPEDLHDIKSMMSVSITATLNTGSTTSQGKTSKGGKKMGEEHRKTTAVCYLNAEDMKTLPVAEGERVKLKSDVGEVVLYAAEGELPKGCVFVPRGPWANHIIDADSYGTGSPCYKTMKVVVEPTTEEVLKIHELLKKYRGE